MKPQVVARNTGELADTVPLL